MKEQSRYNFLFQAYEKEVQYLLNLWACPIGSRPKEQKINSYNPPDKTSYSFKIVPQVRISFGNSLLLLKQLLRVRPPEDHAGKSTVHITDSPETWHTCTILLVH